MQQIPPVLDPVLEKRFVRSGKGWKIALADKEVDYAETFSLFFTTRLPNPHFTPELSAKVTVIDFTVTLTGTFGWPQPSARALWAGARDRARPR